MRFIIGTIQIADSLLVRRIPCDKAGIAVGEPIDEPSLVVEAGSIFAQAGVGLVLKTKEDKDIDNSNKNPDTGE